MKYRNILAAALVALPLAAMSMTGAQAAGNHGGGYGYNSGYAERGSAHVNRRIYQPRRFYSERRHVRPSRFVFLKRGHGGRHR